MGEHSNPATATIPMRRRSTEVAIRNLSRLGALWELSIAKIAGRKVSENNCFLVQVNEILNRVQDFCGEAEVE